MTPYTVICHNAEGRRVTVTVTAATDEQACAAALKTLNTWLAVSALPATVVLPKPKQIVEPPVSAPAVKEDTTLEIGHIVSRGTVVDWIASRSDRDGVGAVGAALIAARERDAA